MKSTGVVFLLFLLIALITFFPTIGSGFVYDFLGWQKEYEQGQFSDILNCFGYHGNHQVLHFFFYSIYSLFFIKGLPWYLIFCGLHAFNGILLYQLLAQITSRWKLTGSRILILLICVLFIIHPYHVEPVVWKVCIHYLLSLSFLLSLLLLAPKYLTHGSPKFFWISLLVFTASLFTLEVSFITPTVITLYILIEWLVSDKTGWSWRRATVLASSLWGLLAANLLLNKWTLGAWVGHYGTETHLSIDVIGMMSTEVKYLVKHLFDARFFSFKTKSFLFDHLLSNPELIFFILTFCIGLVIVYFLKLKKLSGHWHLLFFGTLGSMLYVLPVSNIFFFHLQIGMNDRYSYLPMTFLLMAAYSLISKLPKWSAITLMSILILGNVFLQQKTIRYWHQSAEVLNHLRDTYRWNDHSHVFVLNAPDNLNGIVMASIYGEPSGIDEIIDYQTPKPNNGVMYDVFQYNMTTPEDGVRVEQTGPLQLKVTFSQWGNWWHRNGIGASSYENEYYKAEILEYPYQLTFKQFPEGSVIIYQVGKEWKEFHFKEME